MGGMRVITANVNGIRAAVRRGAVPWLVAAEPDVLALQETRATRAQFDQAIAGTPLAGYTVHLAGSSAAGRAGVALLTRPGWQVSEPVIGLPDPGPQAAPGAMVLADEGRWLEATVQAPFGPVTLASAYVHSGDAARPEVMAAKYAMLDAVTARLRRARDDDEPLLVAGDLNVAHREADIKNWRGNVKKAGFLPQERAYLDAWIDGGLVADIGREQSGPGPGPYTWWTWRGQAFDNDAGWRIDYQLATPALAARVRHHEIGRAAEYSQRWSDHAPVIVDYGR